MERGDNLIKGYVYAIQHNKTKRVYIGSTRKPRERLKTHFRELKSGIHPQKQMQKDYLEFGNDFTIYLLHEGELNKRDMLEIEYLYMTVFKTRNPLYGYNLKEETKDHDLSDFPVISQDFSTVGVEKLQRKRASTRAVSRELSK